MKKLLLTCVLITAACLAPTVASAQNRSNTGTGNTGSSGFGNTGSSAFGSTSASGLGGSSPFGSTGGSGSTGFGAQNGQGANGQTGFGGQNQLGANGNNGGILGRNTNQNQGILGRNVQNQGAGGNAGQGGGRGGGGNRGNNGLNSQNGGGGNGTNANQIPLVRPRQRVAFEYRLPTSDAIQTTLETRLAKLSVKKAPGLKSVMVAVEDKGEIILRGEVGSASEAKLAENMLRLEPGVRTVRNELTFPAVVTPDE